MIVHYRTSRLAIPGQLVHLQDPTPAVFGLAEARILRHPERVCRLIEECGMSKSSGRAV